MHKGTRNRESIVQELDRVVVVITESRFNAARSASGPGTAGLITKAAPLLTILSGAGKIRQQDDQTCFSFSVAPPTGYGLSLSTEHPDQLASRMLQLGHENEAVRS